MSKKYVIDACALINASKNYNMTKKAFSHIWQAAAAPFRVRPWC